MFGILLDLPIKGLLWLLEELYNRAYEEFMDENAVRGRLLEARMLHELGELSHEEYETLMAAIHERLRAIKAFQESEGGGKHHSGALEVNDLEIQVQLTNEG